MDKKTESSTNQESFLTIFEKTKSNIERTWPDWKKNVTPIETTASTITFITRSDNEENIQD